MSFFYLNGIIALIALVLKIGFLFRVKIYSQLSAATVILALLLVMQNSTEFLGYLTWFDSPGISEYFIHFYMASLYAICCGLVYFCAVTAEIKNKTSISVVYALAALYLAYLHLTGQLIAGFSQHDYTITSEAGALYSHFLVYVLACIATSLGFLIHGITNKAHRVQTQCKMVLLALSPMFAIGFAVAVLRALGIDASSALFLPLATTVFLVSLLYMDEEGAFLSLSIKWQVIRRLCGLKTLNVNVWKDTIEEELILGAIKYEPNSQRKAADLINMSQPTMCRRLDKMQSHQDDHTLVSGK
ncbi:MAG: hypothetical protein AB8B95_01820 [Pseudohongiellaceae bacterium]